MQEHNLKGYVMVPRILLHDIIEEHPEASGDNEAFLRVLLNLNYKPAVFRYNGEEHLCNRGESLLSYKQWAHLFGWTRNRIRRFFQRLFDKGVAVIVPNSIISHIRIPGYDAWLSDAAKQDLEPKLHPENGFRQFWEEFHETTRLDKCNIAKARKEWNKLSIAERERAVANITDYYVHLGNTKYCLHAVNYLAHKAFDNEYGYE